MNTEIIRAAARSLTLQEDIPAGTEQKLDAGKGCIQNKNQKEKR